MKIIGPVVCMNCDASQPTPEAAKSAGWKSIIADREGLSWNAVGCCPECEPSLLGERPVKPRKAQSELF